MRWKIDLNETYEETEVIIHAPKQTKNISRLTAFIDQLSHTLLLSDSEHQIIIDIRDILYIETVNRITFLYTETDIYEDSRPLYEIEQMLIIFDFLRINKQTLINPRYIQSVRALLNSRYELLMTSGEKLIVTRHYRKSFKELFEEGGLYDA
ncbi:MAG TPA: LytTR family DNA-binding domain-containing protein [Bacillota bacterium]|nr:LytTR family DNA-binding domain-containing protein [Bacillota bacterium]